MEIWLERRHSRGDEDARYTGKFTTKKPELTDKWLTDEWWELTHIPDTMNIDDLYLVSVIYQSGDSFSTTYGNIGFLGVVQTQEEAEKIIEQCKPMESSKYSSAKDFDWDTGFNIMINGIETRVGSFFGYFETSHYYEINRLMKITFG